MQINNKIIIVDGISGEVIEREMTTEELSEFQSQQITSEEQIAQANAALAAKVAAQAKLTALGLTVEDLQALGL